MVGAGEETRPTRAVEPRRAPHHQLHMPRLIKVLSLFLCHRCALFHGCCDGPQVDVTLKAIQKKTSRGTKGACGARCRSSRAPIIPISYVPFLSRHFPPLPCLFLLFLSTRARVLIALFIVCRLSYSLFLVGTPQQRALFKPCSAQIPHVASPQSRRLPTRGLRASQRQQNTISPVCVRTLTPVRTGATPSARHGSCRGSGIIRARIATRTSRWSVPTMTMTTEEAGRHRGVRRQKQTTTDRNNSCRRRRRTIDYRGAGWRDSWRGQQGQRRPRLRHCRFPRPQCHFRMRSRRPRLLLLQRQRPTRCRMRVDSRRRR